MGVAGHEGILISQPVLPAGGVCGVHQRGHEVRGDEGRGESQIEGGGGGGEDRYRREVESRGEGEGEGGREGETWGKREGRRLLTLALPHRLSGNGEPGSETSAPGVPSAPPPSSSSSSSACPPDQQAQAISYPNMPAPSSTDQRQQQLMQQGRPMAALPISTDDDPLATLFPDLTADILQQAAPTLPSGPSPSTASSSLIMDSYAAQASQPGSTASSQISVPSSYVLAPTGPILTTPAATTLEENAATAHRVLEQYQKQTASPPHRKDLNFEFPPGLFPEKEVDLEGSLQAYQILQQGMENPEQFLDMFVQREADPFHQQHMFGDIDFDVFD